MHLPINATVMTTVVAACLAWPVAVEASNAYRYGKQQLLQKQNRYNNPMWLNAVDGAEDDWTYRMDGGGNPYRHYPASTSRYQPAAVGANRPVSADDYYDAETSAYDRRPFGDRSDYAVVRYPSYGVLGGGYYPKAAADDLTAFEGPSDDDPLYGGRAFRDSVVPSALSSSPLSSSSVSAFYSPAGPIDRYAAPPPPPVSQSNRYESIRYPTDKIHKFRKVFMSNLVSPSNAFKSTKEQQLYDFWESLINGDLDDVRSIDAVDDDDGALFRRYQLQSSPEPRASPSGSSQMYQHLSPIFDKLQNYQRQRQQRQQSTGERPSALTSSPSTSSGSAFAPPPVLSSLPTLSSSSALPLSQTVPRGSLFRQWANGSPLIKRSSSGSPLRSARPDNDDVRQLERLKTHDDAPAVNVTDVTDSNTTTAVAVTDTDNATAMTAIPVPMADGGQREYVLPRPAGEKSGFESFLEVIAEGGLRGNSDENSEATGNDLRQEAKVNKKRSFVPNETPAPLAAQLGALRNH